MSTSANPSRLGRCGCCEGEPSPLALYNRPGKPALAYRLGTHSAFLHRMLARLSMQPVPDGTGRDARPLARLTTRASDDPAIALLDAWATVADVLTFYQERIANEGYLRTATERASVLELARAIGYELNPGVAASTFLAFTVEDAKGAPGRAIIGEATKILSVPGQNQRPQTFETAERIEARAEWNVLRPRRAEPQQIGAGSTALYLKGVATQLQPGDTILFVGDERQRWFGSERWDLRTLQTVTEYPEENYTLVTWRDALGHEKPTVEPADHPRVFAFRQRAALFGYNAPDWRAMPLALKQSYKDLVPEDHRTWGDRWPNFEIQTIAERRIDLDAVYPKILPGSWIALLLPTYAELYRATNVTFGSRSDFTLTAKTTRVELDIREHLSLFGLRDTVVFAQSEELDLADRSLTAPVYGDEIVLDRLVPAPEAGRTLIVSGKRVRRVKVAERRGTVRVGRGEEVKEGPDLLLVSAEGSRRKLESGDVLDLMSRPSPDPGGGIIWHLRDRTGLVGFVTVEPDDIVPEPAAEADETISEVTSVKRVSRDEDRLTITLSEPLRSTYDRSTVTLHANVARATHGETVREVLGSGDGAQANLRFALKKPPLTYVSAPTPSGAKSTLQLRVDDVLWGETPSLYLLDAQSRCYMIRIEDDGTTAVTFGDGERGARPPSGQENVVATYRSGIGPEGEVGAGSLSILQTRPLGVRDVTNPLPASGAAAPEMLAEARANAPVTVLALERIVSLRDFENFARAFAGIGKAQAVVLWNGETRLAHLTVASANGKEIDRFSDVYLNLRKAIDAVRDPVQQVLVHGFEPAFFDLAAQVRVDPTFVAADVLAEAKAALLAAFAFDKRAFGQEVTAAEVVTEIQKVPGVVATNLTRLNRPAKDGPSSEPEFAARLPALTARWESDVIRPAQLLLINPDGIKLGEMSS